MSDNSNLSRHKENFSPYFRIAERLAIDEKLFVDAYKDWQTADKINQQQYRQQLIEAERRLFAEMFYMTIIYMYMTESYRYSYHHLSQAVRHWVRPRVWLHEAEKTGQSIGQHWHHWREENKDLTGRLIADARQNLGKPVWAFTKFASLCQSGNLGCAATVGELLQEVGVKISGSAGVYGVVDQLSHLGWQKIKINDKQQFRAGDVVFGVHGSKGHIGIISAVNNGNVLVCDNSSSSGTLKERTIESGGSFTPDGRFAGHLYVMRSVNS